MCYAPEQCVNTLALVTVDYKKIFFGDRGGWKIRTFKVMCPRCGCHFCYLFNNKEELKAMMVKVSTSTKKVNKKDTNAMRKQSPLFAQKVERRV